MDIRDVPGYILTVKVRISALQRRKTADLSQGRKTPRIVAAFCAGLVFISCTVEDRFSEYRGLNLIAGYTLDMWVPDFNEAAAPVPEKVRIFRPRLSSRWKKLFPGLKKR